MSDSLSWNSWNGDGHRETDIGRKSFDHQKSKMKSCLVKQLNKPIIPIKRQSKKIKIISVKVVVIATTFSMIWKITP